MDSVIIVTFIRLDYLVYVRLIELEYPRHSAYLQRWLLPVTCQCRRGVVLPAARHAFLFTSPSSTHFKMAFMPVTV